MDFDSPDVEKDFPGLYASESGSGRKKDESDFSDGDHEKHSKKELLIGRRKDKKDKKDRGYAALEGESSPEEEAETKSPSKSMKKVKAFKFPTKSKEKREKSRDKEKLDVIVGKDKDVHKDVSLLDEKKNKKEKDKKEKDKKEKCKDKEKEKKDKKLKHTGSAAVSEEILDLGDAQPIFGVSLGLSVERSRCHDNVNLPLVVRDCIDYLQEFGLTNDQIYKSDAVKSRLIQLKKLYNNRESTGIDDFDVPTAGSLLKLFLNELPEPLLTTDLLPRFEEAASLPQVTEQQEQLNALIEQLPSCNRVLISWLILHLDAVTANEKFNKTNAQNLAMLLSPSLQMSHRLLVALLCHCSNLFGDINLFRYIPPLTSTSPNLPDTIDEIQKELRKQESLLTQIHSEMNAGFVSKKREEQLWEVQRIITQLKRKLRSFEKKQDSTQKSVDDTVDGDVSIELTLHKTKSSCSDDESSCKTMTVFSAESTTTNTETKNTPQEIPTEEIESHKINEKLTVSETGLLLLPENHPEYLSLIRLQLENLELMQWKMNLQSRITAERCELVRIKNNLHQLGIKSNVELNLNDYLDNNIIIDEPEYEKIISHYIKENQLLEHKKNILANDLINETNELIQLQVELNLQKYRI